MPGYSGTPLPRKLGLAPGQRLLFIDPPEGVDRLLGDLPEGARLIAEGEFDLAILFARDAGTLAARFGPLPGRMARGGMIWVAWPKKASGFVTDLSEDVVRGVGLGAGLVDVKVCAIDDFWSGLKFLRRRVPLGERKERS